MDSASSILHNHTGHARASSLIIPAATTVGASTYNTSTAYTGTVSTYLAAKHRHNVIALATPLSCCEHARWPGTQYIHTWRAYLPTYN